MARESKRREKDAEEEYIVFFISTRPYHYGVYKNMMEIEIHLFFFCRKWKSFFLFYAAHPHFDETTRRAYYSVWVFITSSLCFLEIMFSDGETDLFLWCLLNVFLQCVV